MSAYRLQIINAQTGVVVTWRGGERIELDLAEALCFRLKHAGVGFGVSEAKVLEAVRREMAALLYDLKAKV